MSLKVFASVSTCAVPRCRSLKLLHRGSRWKAISSKLKLLGDKRNIASHGLTMFDATRPTGERLFMTTNLNNPDKRQNVYNHNVGRGSEDLAQPGERVFRCL